MSDEMAEKVEAEKQQTQTAEQQAQAEQQRRVWVVMLALDPETGQLAIQPNPNVKKSRQLDAIIAAAVEEIALRKQGRVLSEVIGKLLETKKGRKLFGV